MIELIEGLPDNVVGVEIDGKVEANDYTETLEPAVARVIEAHGKVRVLYVIGESYGFSAGAMWEDAKVGLGDREAWERIAVVSDHETLLGALKLFTWMVPGEARTYAMDEMEDAKAWLSET